MKTSIQLFRWLPRVMAILMIAFISLFALDVFDSSKSTWQELIDFFIHLSPSFILLIILVFAWKRPLTGGILFSSIGLIMIPFIFLHNYRVNHFSIAQCIKIVLLINLPFIIMGILFIISHLKNNKANTSFK